MSQLSDDGFWQFENGQWVPSPKQLEALSEGAVPHTETEFGSQQIGQQENIQYQNQALNLIAR